MKIAIFSDIHDNEVRLLELGAVVKKEKITIGICCGDVSSLETLNLISKMFDRVYLALGNADFRLKQQLNLIPENVKAFERFGALELEDKKIAIVHKLGDLEDHLLEKKYDLVFYGHTHTPWEKRVGEKVFLNPGEVAGQYGPASFCLFDLSSSKGSLRLLK